MKLDQARRDVAAALSLLREAGISLPVPWDARAYCDQLASWRGRPIHLVLGHTGVSLDHGSTSLASLKDSLRARAGYDHPEELAAECFATTLGVRVATRPIPVTPLAPGDADAVERLAAALGAA